MYKTPRTLRRKLAAPVLSLLTVIGAACGGAVAEPIQGGSGSPSGTDSVAEAPWEPATDYCEPFDNPGACNTHFTGVGNSPY